MLKMYGTIIDIIVIILVVKCYNDYLIKFKVYHYSIIVIKKDYFILVKYRAK